MLSAEFTTTEITCGRGSACKVSKVGKSLEIYFVLFEAESCHITQASLNIMAVLLNDGIAGLCHLPREVSFFLGQVTNPRFPLSALEHSES